MMNASKRMARLGLCVFAACAGRQRLPPGQIVEFGGQRAQYHDLSSPKVNICRADPAQLQREFDEMNTLLGTFLDSTPSKPDPNATQAQIEMLQGSPALLPAVRAYELELQKAGQCKFDRKYDFRDLLQRGTELVDQAQKRIDAAPALVNYLNAQKALGQWQSAQRDEMANARSRHCQEQAPQPAPPPRQRKKSRRQRAQPTAVNSKPVVYYAVEDERGNRQWLFCDGSRVVASGGQSPQYVPGTRRSNLPAKAYLDIAARYPGTEVNRAPRLPPLQ